MSGSGLRHHRLHEQLLADPRDRAHHAAPPAQLVRGLDRRLVLDAGICTSPPLRSPRTCWATACASGEPAYRSSVIGGKACVTGSFGP